MNALGLELDHVVILSAVDAPEARQLESLGLLGYGGVTRHDGLGTASTSFFVRDHYLELFWAHDDAQALEACRGIGLDVVGRRRWRETGMSPFGIMLRPELSANRVAPLPFPTRPLQVGGLAVQFANSEAGEPYYGVVPAGLSYPAFRQNITQLEHPLGVKQLTGVAIAVADDRRTRLAEQLMQAGLLTVQGGPEPLMTLTFDAGSQGRIVDVRPTLPLVLRC